MGEQVGGIFVDLSANSAAFDKDMGNASRSLRQAQQSMNRELGAFDGAMASARTAMGGFVSGLFSFRGALGIFATVAGTAGIGAVVKASLDATGGLGELAEQLGTTTDKLQAYRFGAVQAGVSQQELDKGLQKLTQTIGDAAKGEEQAEKAFTSLGISLRDSAGRIKSTDTVLAEVADRIAGIQDPARRAAAVVDLFGRAGQRLLPILSGGAAGLREIEVQAIAAGAVLDKDMIAAADGAADAVAKLELSLTQVKNALIVALAPAIKAFADSWVEAIKKIREARAFDAAIKDQQQYLALLTEERALQAQIAALEKSRGTGFMAQAQGEQLRVAKEQLALVQAELARQRTPATVDAAGNTTPPPSPRANDRKNELELLDELQKEIDARKAAELAANDAIVQSYIESFGNVGKLAEEHRRKMLEQANAVSQGLNNLNDANARELERRMDALQAASREFGSILGDAFQQAIAGGQKLGDVLKGLVANFALRKGTDLLQKVGGSLFDSVLGNLFPIAGARAAGGPVAPGSTYLVGEEGPELFTPERGGRIVANDDMGGGGMVVHIDARGADISVERRLRSMMAELSASIEPRAVAANARAASRPGAIRRAIRG